jgi:hypothetical protein
MSVLDYSLPFMAFSFLGEGGQSAQGLCWFIFLGWGWVGMGDACGAIMLTCIFCSFMQAALMPGVGEKWCHLVPCREAFHGLGVQNVAGFDSDWSYIFCLLGEE